ncbi:pentapeptide repeat-containing protein [Xenococcus sp. PCC 7305]|uniref:pentapeptide repeat-containing protein n=1 Tax=Xenococcus sp. PCC 7305 TaxID=102125 RepID=UPI0005939D9C
MTEQPTKSNSNPENLIPDGNQDGQNAQVEIENSSLSYKPNTIYTLINPLVTKISTFKMPLTKSQMLLISLVVMGIGLWSRIAFLAILGAMGALLLSLGVVINSIRGLIARFLTPSEKRNLLAFISFALAIAVLLKYLGFYVSIGNWLNNFKYDEFGSWAEWVGALGQISIAILAVYVAWAQYIISRDLTIQQNLITQQQTIDAYFQGISDLTINEEGLLEDWPQERAIAEGRTAAILSSVDSAGKAKILRFLSQSRLLTPLQRDSRLGRPMLDGTGGYAEDRLHGIRVIDLGVILAGTDLSGQDLRWTDLSNANMVRTNLSQTDLVKANLSRTVLYEANLEDADLKGTILFYGEADTATPRTRTAIPNYKTGEHTGMVVERANLSQVKRLNEEQRYYLCAWCGEKSRETIPGGCQGIPNKLGR